MMKPHDLYREVAFMLVIVVCVQITVFLLFYLLERLNPARPIVRPKGFELVWVLINAFAITWANVAMYYYSPSGGVIDTGLPPVTAGLIYYLIYTFVAYWYHRMRHSNKFLWRYVHRFHHSAPQMETTVAFYKHPTEYILNTAIVLSLAWVLSVPVEAVALALTIEGCLECFHHSNIKIPKKYHWIGWFIQTPEMHLIHHEYGQHRYNYATCLWDTIFGTARVSTKWNGRLGFKSSFDTYSHILLKK